MIKINKINLVLMCFILLFSLASCKKNDESYTEHITYHEYTNVAYGRHKRQVLDLFLPKGKQETGLILFIHGGAWASGDKEVYTDYMRNWCENLGYATCAVNYHYISARFDYKDILDDIEAALSKVKNIANDKNLNIEKMLLTGHSAGGHLSLLYGYARVESSPIKPACIVSYCGPTDLTDENYYIDNELSVKLVYLFSNLTDKTITAKNYTKKTEHLLKASPINYITSDSIPTVICHGDVDDIVPYSNAVTLHNKLNDAGVLNYLITYKNSGHGLENDPDATATSDRLMLEFANTYLK